MGPRQAGHNGAIGGGGFHHLALRVSNFDASLRFYCEGLGCRRVYGWGEGAGRAAMLDTGDGNYLEVFAGGDPAAVRPEALFFHVALRTTDCDAAVARARAAGAVITHEPRSLELPGEPPLPVRLAFCTGPDGEVIEFFQGTDL